MYLRNLIITQKTFEVPRQAPRVLSKPHDPRRNLRCDPVRPSL